MYEAAGFACSLNKEFNDMMIVTNKEMLEPTGLEQCYFFPERVDNRRKPEGLIRLFYIELLSGLPVGEVCVFFVKGRDFVKLLKRESWGWDVELLSLERSKAFLDLEWLAGSSSLPLGASERMDLHSSLPTRGISPGGREV
jgi:hypothetical protein